MLIGMMQPVGNKFGIHSRFQSVFAKSLRQRGVEVTQFSLNDPDLIKVLSNLRERDDSVVYLGQIYDPIIQSKTKDQAALPEWLGRPSVGSLADHPFSRWRLSSIMRMSSRVHLVGRDPGYRLALSCIRPEYTRFRVSPSIRPAGPNSSPLKPYAKRSIDLLLAMDFRSEFPPLEELVTECKGLGLDGRLPTDYFDAAIHDTKSYPFELFERLFSSLHGMTLQDVSVSNKGQFKRLLLLLHNLDMLVRGQRRLSLLNKLKLAQMPGRIVILADRSTNLPDTPNIEYLGPVQHADYRELLRDSRLHLFANPTYPNVVNERIPVSLAAGCAVVCDAVPALTDFSADEAVFVCSGETSLSDISQIASVDYDERISHGRQRVAKYPSQVDVLYDVFQTLLDEK